MMILTHGHWLPPLQPAKQGRFILWAEISGDKLRKPRGRPRIPPHAYAASPGQLRQTLEKIAALPETRPVPITLTLPALKNLPLPSPRLLHEWDDTFAGVAPTGLKRFKLEGLSLEPTDALYFLNWLPAPGALPPRLAFGDDLIYWVTVARLGLEILAAQRYIPAIEHVDTQTFHASWKPVFDRANDATRLSQLVRAMPPAARACLPAELTGDLEPPPAHRLLEDFLTTVVDAAVREWH
ncbi:MAG: hypothetical protein ACE5GO_12505, partial [Anaerolineales bacterium]